MENSVIQRFVYQNSHIQWHSLHKELINSGASFQQIEGAFIQWYATTSYRPKKRCISQYFHLRHADLLNILKTIKN